MPYAYESGDRVFISRYNAMGTVLCNAAQVHEWSPADCYCIMFDEGDTLYIYGQNMTPEPSVW